MKRPLRNMSALFLGDVASRGIGFLVTVYLARILGPAGFGLVSLGMGLLGHLQLLSSPGIQLVETRNTARPGGMDDSRFGGVLALRLVLSLSLFGIASLVLIGMTDDPVVRNVIFWSLVSLFPLALSTDWYLQGTERMEPIGVARFAGYCLYGIAAWVLVKSADHVAMAPAAFFIGLVATSAMLWRATASHRPMPRWQWDPKLWRQILWENLPVGAAVFVGQMVTNLPPVIITGASGTADAGVYNAAMRLVFLLLIADRVLNALLLPALTRIRETAPAELGSILAVVTKVVATGAVAIVLLGTLLAPWAIQLVYGAAYGSATQVLRILLLYVGLTLINSIASAAVLAAGFERLYSGILVRGSLVLVVAMILLTPFFGIVGTAVGAVVGELATLVLMAQQARREGLFPGVNILTGPLIAGSAAGALGWLLWPLQPVAAAGAAAVLFIGLLVIFRVFKSEDLSYLKERLV